MFENPPPENEAALSVVPVVAPTEVTLCGPIVSTTNQKGKLKKHLIGTSTGKCRNEGRAAR